MLTLYSYPPLFGVADNNGYGLKVYAFRSSRASRSSMSTFSTLLGAAGQLPYIVDDGEALGDSQDHRPCDPQVPFASTRG